jgi:hypothetical protein
MSNSDQRQSHPIPMGTESAQTTSDEITSDQVGSTAMDLIG